MPWGADVPEWIPKFTKKFYALCQLFATAALLGQGTQLLDGAFSIIFPIQLSTFLMTLASEILAVNVDFAAYAPFRLQVRKSLITGTQWHLLYALSLSIIFWLPISVLFRCLLAISAGMVI